MVLFVSFSNHLLFDNILRYIPLANFKRS